MSVRSNALKPWLWFSAKLMVAVVMVAAIIYQTRFAPVPVTRHAVRTADVVAEVMGTGTLEARVTASISPKISGRVVEVVVDQGDRVQAGQLLLRLDDEELIQEVEIARANVAATRAAVERLKADKLRAAAILEQAQRHYERSSQLIESKSVSVDTLDKARESLYVAQAGITSAEAGTQEAQQEMVAAEKTFEYRRARLANTRVVAPFDGLIVARLREPGDVVVPGSSVLRLISTDDLWISAWVDETEMAKVAEGQEARVIFRSEVEQSYRGTVARLGREADRETREFVVDVAVLDLPENWAVGQRADVFVEVAHRNSTMVVPPEAVVWRDAIEKDVVERVPGVFVDDVGVATWQSVKLGLRSRGLVEVVDGLTLGTPVIVATREGKSLVEGARITSP